MLFRKIASLLFAGMVAAACLTPAFGAENARPDIGNPFPNLPETAAEIQDLQVIDRELYASYAAPCLLYTSAWAVRAAKSINSIPSFCGAGRV